EAPGPWAGGDGLGCRSHRSGPGLRAAAWRSATARGRPGVAGAGPADRGRRTGGRGELTVAGRSGQRPGEVVVTSWSRAACRARIVRLSYLPTDVRGIWSTKAQWSGRCQSSTESASDRQSERAVAVTPDLRLTRTNGRLPQRSSGTPTTAASVTRGSRRT